MPQLKPEFERGYSQESYKLILNPNALSINSLGRQYFGSLLEGKKNMVMVMPHIYEYILSIANI